MNTIEEGRKVFDAEIEALIRTRDSLDEVFEQIVDCFYNCEGKVITVGLGKSGHAAKKIAATLSSLGTPSFFLSPSEALHGDLGMVTRDDVLLMISYSGEAEEIKKILPIIKENGCTVTAITGGAGSTLEREADIAVVLPAISEACSFGLAPTSSTPATLCYGDAIAVALSIRRGFRKEDFQRLHPSGVLARK